MAVVPARVRRPLSRRRLRLHQRLPAAAATLPDAIRVRARSRRGAAGLDRSAAGARRRRALRSGRHRGTDSAARASDSRPGGRAPTDGCDSRRAARRRTSSSSIGAASRRGLACAASSAGRSPARGTSISTTASASGWHRHHYLQPFHAPRYGLGNLLKDGDAPVAWHQWYGSYRTRLAAGGRADPVDCRGGRARVPRRLPESRSRGPDAGVGSRRTRPHRRWTPGVRSPRAARSATARARSRRESSSASSAR